MTAAQVNAFARISIHAPREGRDINIGAQLVRLGISIHAPREGRD